MIWILSYPKSGNTWLRIMLALAKHRGQVDAETLVANLRDYAPWEADLKWFEPFLSGGSGSSGMKDILAARPRAQAAMEKASGGDAIVKSHNIVATMDGTPLFPQGPDHRAVHLVRNPLDVAVSIMHHMGLSQEEAARAMLNPRLIMPRGPKSAWEFYGSWERHTRRWVEAPPYPVVHVRYEDLVASDTAVLSRVLAHAGLSVSEDDVPALYNETAIAKLRAAEDRVGFNDVPSAKSENFFRSGTTGAWKSELSADVRETIVKACGPMMGHFGFEY